jgi:flagellar basal-body rod modification protein FlgD
MTINGIQTTDPLTSPTTSPTSAPAATGSSALGKDAFMTLLVDQIKNQDPLSPSDNTQYLAQLAQFSSLEQMQSLNDNLVGMAVLQQNNALMSQLTQSSTLIGQTVVYTDPATGQSATGAVSSVKIQDNVALLTIGGEDVPLANVTQVLGHMPVDGTAPGAGTDTGSGTGGDTGTGTTDPTTTN